MAKLRTGSLVGDWVVGRQIGSGGNGTVYEVSNSSGAAALKILNKRWWRGTRLSRFKDEVSALRRCADILGVIPLLDASIPDAPIESDPPWICMGLASPMRIELGENPNFEIVVEAVRDLAAALAAMHERGISHRDIKPENLFYFDGGWAVGDLGLAQFEGKVSATAVGEKMGPLYYIAPEMLNDARSADGRPADVYSLAKVLWVLGTGQKYPLPGRHDSTVPAMMMSSYVSSAFAAKLNRLLEASTEFDPSRRPTMAGFRRELDAWLAPVKESDQQELDILDISAHRKVLDARSDEMQSTQEVEQRDVNWRQETGRRIREHFRVLNEQLVEALRCGGFASVETDIDRHHWGFAITGMVPYPSNPKAVVRLKLMGGMHNLESSGQTGVRVQYSLNIWRSDMTTEEDLWSEEIAFLEGGSEEDIAVAKIISNIRMQFRSVVTTAISTSERLNA